MRDYEMIVTHRMPSVNHIVLEGESNMWIKRWCTAATMLKVVDDDFAVPSASKQPSSPFYLLALIKIIDNKEIVSLFNDKKIISIQ